MIASEPAGSSSSAARAPFLLLATALLWGGAGLMIKATPLSGPRLALWRCLAGAVAYQTILLARGHRPSWQQLKTGALSGVGFGLSLVLTFIALKATTLVSANVIVSVQPLLLGVAGRHVFRDTHGRAAIAATLAAVAGTIVVVLGSASSGAASVRGDLAAAGATVIGCLYPIGVKKARREMGAMELQASALWTAALVVLPAAALTNGGAALPPAHTWIWIAAIVAVGGTGHLLFTSAQHHVSVLTSSTITLLEIVVVAIGGALAFHQQVTPQQIVGIGIVALAVGWWVAKLPPAAEREI